MNIGIWYSFHHLCYVFGLCIKEFCAEDKTLKYHTVSPVNWLRPVNGPHINLLEPHGIAHRFRYQWNRVMRRSRMNISSAFVFLYSSVILTTFWIDGAFFSVIRFSSSSLLKWTFDSHVICNWPHNKINGCKNLVTDVN